MLLRNCLLLSNTFLHRTFSVPTCVRCITRSYSSQQNQVNTRKFIWSSSLFSQGRKSILQNFSKHTTTVPAAAKREIPRHAERLVGKWLMGCAAMTFGAVVLGGVTRLTESGLSMTEWRLLQDMKWPSAEQWEEEFAKYKASPEYKYLHESKGMTLAQFKFIYFMEYFHRMWGRSIGLFFFLPALYFGWSGYISKAMKPRIFIYGGLLLWQGALGWYMVKSGLEEKPDSTDIPRVSQYRLASHLGSAFILYSLFLWQGLNHLLPNEPAKAIKNLSLLKKCSHGVMALVFTTAMSGAFVAGLDAGLVYNSWPKMADRWIPEDILTMSPKWKNIFENTTTVQFNHRHLGEITGASIIGLWVLCRKAPLPRRARIAVNALLGMSFIQITLGITTLLTYVPTEIAATHQSGSLILLSLALWFANELKRIPK